MAAHGVFVATAGGFVATVRGNQLLVSPLHPAGDASARFLRFELLAEPAALTDSNATASTSADAEADPEASSTNKRISAFQFFQPVDENTLAVLLLVNERRLVHYELDTAANLLVFRSSRPTPRSANGLALARVRVADTDHHVVLVSEKTGEAVAMPFPDVSRGLKTLLTHTTSMITHMALTCDSLRLVTADRDEKIRVSRFPQTAVVDSYCLGHKASVTRVACLFLEAAGVDLLVSTSLDNTLKLWRVATGEQLDSHALLRDEEVASDDKALFTVSLAASPTANIVAVLVNYRTFHVFQVVANESGESFGLKLMEVVEEDKAAVLTGEPCEVTFAETGELVVAAKKKPFVQVFGVRLADSEAKITAAIPADNECYSDLRKAASTIELTSAEDEMLDELEDGLKKKKVRTEWKARVLGGGN